MSIYNISGSALDQAYDLHGDALSKAYNLDGAEVYQLDSWRDEVTIEKRRYEDTNYYLTIIPQTRSNGQKQYPFVYCPDGTGVCTMSTLDMIQRTGFYFGMNSGVGNVLGGGNYSLDGLTIENSVVILNTPSDDHATNPQAARPLTIDSNGALWYTEYDSDAYDLVADGIVSCISGFMPLVVNGVVQYDWIDSWPTWKATDAQRQIIGQYANGDYAIVTAEGRGYDNSVGLTVPQVAELCVSLGINFAYMCDGGGSAETVVCGEQLNLIYDNVTGRRVPSFIVFNGTDTFSIPE